MKELIDKEIKDRRTWDNIADILTPEGKQKIKTGKVLGFKQEDGEVHHYKVVKINRKSDKFYVQRLNHLMDEEEMQAAVDEQERRAKEAKKKLEENND